MNGIYLRENKSWRLFRFIVMLSLYAIFLFTAGDVITRHFEINIIVSIFLQFMAVSGFVIIVTDHFEFRPKRNYNDKPNKV